MSSDQGQEGDRYRRHVLMVGGSSADRDVISGMLAEAGDDADELVWVASESGVIDGLGSAKVILWRLGSGTRLAEFVEWVDAAEYTAPVVAVMDAGEDDIAAIRAGATDALLFDRLDAGTLSRSIRYSMERHRLIAELEREHQLLHALLFTLPSAIYFKDADSRFLRISRKLANDFRLDHPSDAIGKMDSDFFEEEHSNNTFRDEQALVRGDVDVIRKEEREVWADGSVTWAATSKLPLRDRLGRIVGTFGMSLDVTDKKAAESLLRSDKEAAEDASRAKSDFVANISHEIRTPMNAILGMTDLVLETDLDATQRDYLGMVRESAEALMAIVDDVLDFSKIEAGKMELSPTTVEIRELCAQTLSPLSVRANKKGIDLIVDIDESVPNLLDVDGVRLRQVITNLVVNAIKFTDTGSVTFSLDLVTESEEEVVIRLSVSDTGIGIPRAKLREIFAAFEQADASTTRRFGGTGLGLSISSRIVALMGGLLEVESVEGEGSRFQFSVAVPKGEQLALTSPAEGANGEAEHLAGNLSRMKILIVNDSPASQRVLEAQLRRHAIQTECVGDGLAAAEVVRRGGVDLVLMDVQMPVLDGLAATQLIRQEEQVSGRRIPIVAVTARAMKADRDRCLAAGMDEYVSLPATTVGLLRAMVAAADTVSDGSDRRSAHFDLVE